MKKVLVIPAYNEGSQIEKVIKNSFDFVDEVIVVDDGSSDQTLSIAQNSGAIVYRHHVNRGAGAATITGLHAAINNHNADVVVMCDADGQHQPHEIGLLTDTLIKENLDFVNGSRFLKQGNVPAIRIFYNKIANFITYLFFGLWVTDSQSGFRCFSKNALQKMNLKSNGWEIQSEIIREIKNHNLKYKEVPINVLYTQYSMSKGQNLFKGIQTLWRLIFEKINK